MSFHAQQYPEDKAGRYAVMIDQARALTDGVAHPIANLANIAALLWQCLKDINWCGFYLMDRGTLMLGPFCGLPACIRIPLGRGVCGTAAQQDAIQLVPDVHAFPGHIACDCASNSEIVLPIHYADRVIGVLDIDSPVLSRFDETDRENLLKIIGLIEAGCDFSQTGYSL